jgi:hypothetical protein
VEKADSNVKVLGTRWSLDMDAFSFAGLDLPSHLIVTKRLVLSLLARIFDPRGFLTPFTITAKCIFQKLWQLGLGWDEVIPVELSSQFELWLADFEVIKSWQIPRRYSNVPWSSMTGLELHAFGDASMSGYGTTVYLRIPVSEGVYECSLVMSKNRVAPLKTVTLPRLELLASLLAARLLVFVRKTLSLPEETRYCCWSDSMAALGWVRGDPLRWKQFVANRVVRPIHSVYW